MALLLVDICLRSIMDGAENGTITDLHRFVPSKLRQRLLDMVLSRRKIDHPVWRMELSSPEYLRGFSSFYHRVGSHVSDQYLLFNTRSGNTNDLHYLNLTAESMGCFLENGETIGDRIKKLDLNYYLLESSDRRERFGVNIGGIIRLVGQCPNLKSLTLEMKYAGDTTITNRGEWAQLYPVEWTDSSRSVMENLEELSLAGSPRKWSGWRTRFKDTIIEFTEFKFTKLTTLRLVDCRVDESQWRELTNQVRNTLTELHLADIEIDEMSDVLPFPLPNLKSFELTVVDFRCTSSFVENLRQCSKLETVHLSLEHFAEDEENWMALNRIEAELTVDILISVEDEIRDRNSNFKMVSVFGEKISHLDINFDVNSWTFAYTTALENVVDVCRNLTSFSLETQDPFGLSSGLNLALARLFGDRERASKLRELGILGDIDIDPDVLKAIFENCTNLDALRFLRFADLLADSHLIRWAERLAKPSELWLCQPGNISDDGLIPILINSGNRMKEFHISQNERITDRTWHVLIDRCPNIKSVDGMPDHLKEMASEKCFSLEFE